MRLKHLTISALSLSIFFSANVYGGEDVIVDLSVLNSLQPSTAPMPSYGKSEKPQPLFPIVKKETAKTKKATDKKRLFIFSVIKLNKPPPDNFGKAKPTRSVGDFPSCHGIIFYSH